MKKLLLILLCVPLMFSCGEDSKSDKESNKDKKKDKYKKEIKDPCDILDYTIEIFENLERLSDKYDDIDDLEDDKKDKKRVNAYFDDLEDAWKYSFKKFDVDEMMGLFRNCNNTWQMEELLYEVEYFFQERSIDFIDFIDMKMYDLETEYHEREAASTDYNYTRKGKATDYGYTQEAAVTDDGYTQEAAVTDYGYLYEATESTEASVASEPEAASSYDAQAVDGVEYIQYYHIEDPDGWTNMRYSPNGEIIRKVYSDEEFRVIIENEGWSYVMFDDGSLGYIHSSRIYETY